MIASLLDSDMYKFTTSYAYMSKYPEASGTFTFVDRNHTSITPKQFAEIWRGLEQMSKLRLTQDECEWCKENIPFIPAYYWEWLSTFSFDLGKIDLEYDEYTGEYDIKVTDKLYKVTLYEVPILAVVSEVLSMSQAYVANWEEVKQNMINKLKIASENGFKFSEFGTRRRYSYDMQKFILSVIKYYDNEHTCVGTSNVHFAMLYNMKPMGTHPHEWFMFHGAQFGYKHANYVALNAWQDVYHGDLGIALTDTYTTKSFFSDFNMQLAKLFDGIRHDSGDPYKFADDAVAKYKELGINPKSKTIIFSDGLDFPKAAEIYNKVSPEINCSFGIGTNLTNDVKDIKAPNIVMKLTSCRMKDNDETQECIKLSDVPGKHIGSKREIEVAMYQLDLE